jgi:hypothetical protein
MSPQVKLLAAVVALALGIGALADALNLLRTVLG